MAAAPGKPKASPPCGLASLADERLPGALPGLLAQGGWLEVDKPAFPCCGGSGSRLMAQAEVTVRCELSNRLRVARTLYRRVWERQATLSSDSPSLGVPAPALRRMRAIAAGESNRGLAFITDVGAPPAVSIWALALASAWRYGLTPHVVTLGRGPVTDLFPREGRPGDGRAIILVEGVSALWDAVQADALDALVGYAYRSLTPLFIDLRFTGNATQESSPGATAAPRGTRHAFSSRLAGIKSRSPLSWLTPECAAKIPAVVDGLERFKRTGAPRAKTPRPAPGSPKLPWET